MENRVVVFTISFLFFFLFFFLCGKIFFVPNAEFSGGVHIFCFKLEARCLFKFGSTIQHCQFKCKFGSQTNLIMQNSLAVFTFPVSDGKDHFQANLDKRKSNLSVLYQDQLEYGEFNGGLQLFYVRQETLFFGKFRQKDGTCKFHPKCSTKTNSNMQNSIVVFTFPNLD